MAKLEWKEERDDRDDRGRIIGSSARIADVALGADEYNDNTWGAEIRFSGAFGATVERDGEGRRVKYRTMAEAQSAAESLLLRLLRERHERDGALIAELTKRGVK